MYGCVCVYIYIYIYIIVVALLGDTLTKNSNKTYTIERITSETVSVRMPGLSAEILPST